MFSIPEMKAVTLSIATVLLAAAIASPQDNPGTEKRKAAFLASLPENPRGAFGAVAKYAMGKPVLLEDIAVDLDVINSRKDCSDFLMAGFLRLLYLDKDKNLLDPLVRKAIVDAALNFKYWIDEPGVDSMCYWSENHQILFHSAEYLAGLMFPDEIFTNSGMTGREHAEKARRLMEQYFGWREKFGFSEWLSNVYYEEDLYPLLNLIDFAPDETVRTRATMLVDMLALNIALNSYRGNFTCTHGRTYEKNTLMSRGDKLTQASFILWGVRKLPDEPFRADYGSGFSEVNFGAVALATSTYSLPPAIYNIGADTSASFENFESHGISVDEAPQHGIGFGDIDNGMFFWGMGLYTHYKVANLSEKMFERYNLSKNSFFYGMTGVAKSLVRIGMFDRILKVIHIATNGGFIDDARTYTYRTADYMLSSVLDWRKGNISAQNMAWTATLGVDAIVFTTYPAKMLKGNSPGYWTGNASTPRVAQHKNLLIAIYEAPFKSTLGETYRIRFTHAWFPAYAMDEVKYSKHWAFGRKGSSYIALYSHKPMKLVKSGKYAGNELKARGRKNVWICVMGGESEDGDFAKFVDSVIGASVDVKGGNVVFNRPGRVEARFGWNAPFVVNGEEIPLHRDVRYDNPYVRADRFSEYLEINAGGKKLILDFENHKRIF